jgi:GT2 family glycosyltransferase
LQEKPFCSVIVPTRDRPAQLASCLEALARLDYPRERLEVLVVDDGGALPLDSVVGAVRERLDVRLLKRSHEGAAAASNAGARAARGALLVFTDDDCVPVRGWLRALAERFDPDLGLGGRTVIADPGDACAAAAHLVVEVGYAWHNRDPNRARFLAMNNLALPARRFHDLGGFDTRYTRSADRDLCDRWLANGLRLAFVPEAVVFHAQRLDLRRFMAKHFANGRGVLRFHRAHIARGEPPIKPEPGYYLALLGASLRKRPPGEALVTTALVLLAQAANYTGYAWEFWRSRSQASGRARSERNRAAGA